MNMGENTHDRINERDVLQTYLEILNIVDHPTAKLEPSDIISAFQWAFKLQKLCQDQADSAPKVTAAFQVRETIRNHSRCCLLGVVFVKNFIS